MKNEIRSIIDKLNEFNNKKLNEGIGSCTIDDLYNAVLRFVENDLHYPKENIQVRKENDHIIVTYQYRITTDASWGNLNDDNIVKRLSINKDHFEDYFKKFENFCDKGVRGFVGTFRSDLKMVNVRSDIQMDKLKYVQTNKLNYNLHDKRVFRYTDVEARNIADLDDYIKRNGDKELDFVKINIGIFLRSI